MHPKLSLEHNLIHTLIYKNVYNMTSGVRVAESQRSVIGNDNSMQICITKRYDQVDVSDPQNGLLSSI